MPKVRPRPTRAARPSRGLCPSRVARAALLALLGATLQGACKAPAQYAADADQQVYALVEQRRMELFREDSAFSIDPPQDSLRQRILRGDELDIHNLSLLDCMRAAAENSRDFQTRRERLYLAALDVTLERWRLGWIPDPAATADTTGSGTDVLTSRTRGDLGLSRILGTGAQVVSNLGLGIFKILGTPGEPSLISNLAIDITQPILRGAGARVTKEPLTLTERQLVYEVRAFERFRRTFSVDVADRYYRLLLQINRIENEEANVVSLETLRKRNEALARAGRLNDIEVDQARQDEIRSINRVLVQRLTYQDLMDGFKLFLGLPIDCEVGLNPGGLEALAEQPMEEVTYAPAEVVDFALSNRLDYLSGLDQVADAERQAFLAADDTRAGLDVSAGLLWPSEDGKPLRYDPQDILWSLRLDFDQPWNRIPERNAYRASLIALYQSVRSAEQLGDVITVDLRDSLRAAQTTLESYEIQQNAQRLAERRVESTALNLQAGRANTRDILESQSALLEAQNATSQALIEHYLAKLALYRDMELLVVDEEGFQVATELFEHGPETDA